MNLLAVTLAAVVVAAPVMNTTADLAPILAELARRSVAADPSSASSVAAKAAELRAMFYPKQRAFYGSKHKRRATKKTRRAGATMGGCSELLARSIETAGHRSLYVTGTRIEAKARAWRNDTKSGFVDVIERYGTPLDRKQGVDAYDLGGVIVEVREADLCLEFSNGSQIALFGLKDERSLGKQRGGAKHVVWVDEAQDIAHLERFYKATITAALSDYEGEMWLTGTPGVDCAGMFYLVTADEEADRLEGWEVHTIAVVDNPYFGHVVSQDSTYYVEDNRGRRHGPYQDSTLAEEAAVGIRWENTAGQAKRDNGWSDDDPDFIREWLGRWVKTDARYVYPVHAVPRHVLVFAPVRTAPNPIDASHAPWYDHDAAVADLPRRPGRGRNYEWLYAIGADFGYQQTPFAITMWAFTFDLPDIYEMLSWKQHKVLPDDQRAYLEFLWNTVPNVVAFAGDPAGQKAADLEAWRTRFSIPIDDADKAAKGTWQNLLAGDIRKGHVHYRENSALLHEHRHLVYLPTKPGKAPKDDEFRRIADGTVPGNDCADGGLYAYRFMHHHLFRDKPKDERTVDKRRADAYEEQLEKIEQAKQMMAYDGEGYEW